MATTPAGPRNPLQLATVAEIDEGIRAGFAPGAAHRAVVQQLVTGAQYAEAVRFVAHALPRREGVWWAWVTAKRAAGATPAPPAKAALEATERWIAQPSDANRRLAWDAAQAADVGTRYRDRTAVDALKPGHRHQQRRFARPRRPDQADRLAICDGQTYILENVDPGRSPAECEIHTRKRNCRCLGAEVS